MRTDIGDVRIDVPRDREGTLGPVVVPKHARRLAGFDEAVIRLYATGIATGDIANHPGRRLLCVRCQGPDLPVTDQFTEAMTQWQSRPLDATRSY